MSEPESKRLVGLRFVESVPFAGDELTSATLKTWSARGQTDTITPIRFEADGSAVRIGANQRCDGFALERDYNDRISGKPARERVVVGLAGIRVYLYGPVETRPVDAAK